jgi:L-ascorbate metabolism protein UlaG (beta-lactamase superfamily)
MKITRFPQSCFLIETLSKKILVDLGCLNFDKSFLEVLKGIDILLITHKHQDHCDSDLIKKISPKEIYSSMEVSIAFPELKINIVKEGDSILFESIKINVVHSQHGYLPTLKDGNEIFENIGFIIDDGEKKVYHVGDSICFPNDYKCDVILVPVCNHGLVMGAFEASLFSKETGAKLVIPMHYDNKKYPVDLEKVKKEFEKIDLNYKILDLNESFEV